MHVSTEMRSADKSDLHYEMLYVNLQIGLQIRFFKIHH